MSASDFLRLLLMLGILGMVLLAVFYLRRREMSWQAYLLWGLVALLFPILGPFLVIVCRPGRPRNAEKHPPGRLLS
ncbi:MAG: hypothetical protein WHV66_13985 [Anaerolineales bacterium]